ncbi:MAG: PLP-dependent aminotransferase family protein [Phormidesmis sp.]
MELALNIQPNAKMPLHRQIYSQIRVAILSGRLRSHTQLPASRHLAKSLGVSRSTVTQSYDQLISEGYLHTQPGAGTFVCAHIPDDFLTAELKENSELSPVEPSHTATAYPLSAYGHRLQNTSHRPDKDDCALSFAYGIPDFGQFPIQSWRRLLGRHYAASEYWMNYSPDPMGYGSLREQVARYIAQVRAVQCTPEQILITHGAQQALALIVRVFVNSGEAIAIENPGYLSGRRIFEAHGATVLPVPVDAEGLQIEGSDGLAAVATANTRLAYVTPSHQFPTGVLMSLSRRLALLQWAQHSNALVIEDDYDSEFRYSGRPIPALQGLDTYERVLYVGTFSKIMFPGLQLGYVVVPPPLVAVFKQAKWLCDRQSNLIHQAALADFIAEGYLAKHVRRMRTVYDQRRQALVAALQSVEGQTGTVEILGDQAGLHVMARLPTTKGDRLLVEQARDRGVNLFSAHPHYWQPANHLQSGPQTDLPRKTELIFGFGGISETDIAQAIERIQPLL